MLTCTFFGHRLIKKEIEPMLDKILIDLIENKQVTMFYVGNQGGFDSLVRKNLKKLKEIFPHINYAVVLAYLPPLPKDDEPIYEDFSDTIYPDGIERVPFKFAISWRNKWMIERSDFVVTHVSALGGAATFKELAEKKGKTVINIE